MFICNNYSDTPQGILRYMYIGAKISTTVCIVFDVMYTILYPRSQYMYCEISVSGKLIQTDKYCEISDDMQ